MHVFLVITTLLVVFALKENLCFHSGPSTLTARVTSSIAIANGNLASRGRFDTELKMGIDVSGLRVVPIPDTDLQAALDAAQSTDAGALTSGDLASDLQNVLILAAGISYFFYEKRPRGDARMDLVEIRRSTIANANMGVFSKQFIAADTLVGCFPGFVVNVDDALDRKRDDDAKASAKKYMWSISDEEVLDPTNVDGKLELEIMYFGGLIKVNTAMARVNEPPPGADCNLYTKVDNGQVYVYAERDIFADEELFLDYGTSFDRSDYGNDEALENRLKESRIKQRLDDEEFMTLRPIVDDAKDSAPTSRLETDTTNPSGFIAKLGKKEKAYDDSGIISPEEGAQLFGEFGVRGLTGNAEEREFMESMRKGGKGSEGMQTSGAPPTPPKNTVDEKSIMDSLLGGASIRGVVDGVESGGKAQDGDTDELMADLMKQMGSDNAENMDAIPDLTEATGGAATKVPVPPLSKSADSGSSNKPRTLLTEEETEDLQRRIDNMTDEQVEKVFAKMRGALGEAASEEMADALEEARKLTTSKGKREMPRAKPVDDEVRKKYNRELDAIEDELEKIYNDPLGVWQELITNPESFNEDENPDKLADGEEFS